jgi:prepilin-type N-terminal cleavage/methylation domain-containing protein/prepilin-type processing-associated H-X9-DG protein
MSQRVFCKGFTLVELLVVMTLILMLAAMSYPAYWKVKEHAYNVKCQQHLRGIGRAFAMYATECGSWFPPCHENKVAAKQKDVPWKMMLSIYMGGYNWEDYNKKRVPLHKAFTDPTRGYGEGNYMASLGQFAPVTATAKAETYQGESVKDYNQWLKEQSKLIPRPMNLHDFKYLAHAASVCCGIQPTLHCGYTSGSSQDDNPLQFARPEENRKATAGIEFRHSERANVLFMDGHVQEFVKKDTEAGRDLIDRFNKRYMIESAYH